MKRAPSRKLPARGIGKSLSLMGLGMASVLVPVLIYANIDKIREAMPDMSALADMLSGPSPDPALVTFGSGALVREGDHDFRQVIRFTLPATAGALKVRLFDPDAGGAFDEAIGGFDTTTRFSLYGDGATP